MKKLKKIIILLVCISMIFSITGCSSNSGKKGNNSASEDTTYSWWIYCGETIGYSDYKDNPVVNYLLTKTWGPENKKMDIDFLLPVGGSEKDNCVTLVATGEYPDLMEMTVYPDSVASLYNEGIALDITEYVKQYMPNYLAFLDAHPDLKATAMNVVDGEKKYLGLYKYSDSVPDMWGGYMYRRDWIVKYGKNPTDGSAFSGAYTETNTDGTPNPDTWEDNVIFPSGDPDPVYISDWEWMLDIFQTAIEDQGITDGYCMSLPYGGFNATGDLVGGFGGGGWWNKNPNGKIEYGPSSDSFRTYLQCMNTWYKNGWIDTAFPEHTADSFYTIDSTKIRSGKVGLWYGYIDEFGGRLDTGEEYLDGIAVANASQPINDIYGTAEQRNVTPYVMYQDSTESFMTIVTNKALEKDIPTLFTFLDYLYSKEGSIMRTFGLSKEQYQETQDEFYTTYGLTDGAYIQNEDGTYQSVDTILYDSAGLSSAAALNRVTGLSMVKDKVTPYTEVKRHNLDLWTMYESTGAFKNSFISQLTEEDSKTKSKIETNCLEFCYKNLPSFIQGKQDPYSDDAWNSYLKALNKYGPDTVTQIYQTLYDSLK